MMATIGCRYLVFAIMFDMLFFWIMGVSRIVSTYLALASEVLPVISAGLGRVIEVLSALFLFSIASKAAV